MKTLISFDVDMTLLDHATYKIPDSAMEAIEALRKNHFIVLATGRDMDTYYSRQYRDQIQADAIIHSNGTKITVGDQVLYESVLPRELLERVLHFADEHDLAIGMTSGDDDYYIHPEHVTEHDIRRWGESGRQYKESMEASGYESADTCLYGGSGRSKITGTGISRVKMSSVCRAGRGGCDRKGKFQGEWTEDPM